ncbi:MAG: 30S ribosomal protein S5 [Rickettsiales bacterium]|nr:30S ribosomal protein S5 [Rickettsiales bacterium]
MARNNENSSNESENKEVLVSVKRVAKVVKGGRRFGFSVVIVAGDGKGRVGYGLGKAKEVMEARTKASQAAKKDMIKVHLKENRTIHHDVVGQYGAGKVILRSAPAGTGIIAGGAMRAVFEMLGLHDVVAKSLGSSNVHNMVGATFDALSKLASPKQVAERRHKKVGEIYGSRKVKE